MSTAVLAIRLLLAAVFVVAAVGSSGISRGLAGPCATSGCPAPQRICSGVQLCSHSLRWQWLSCQRTRRAGVQSARCCSCLAFTAGIANALRKGEEPDCHCFGQIHSSPADAARLPATRFLLRLQRWSWSMRPERQSTRGSATATCRAGGRRSRYWRGFLLAMRLVEQLQRNRRLLFDLKRAQRQALSAPPGIPIGSKAPRFTLPNLKGETISLEALRELGRPILLDVPAVFSCGSCVELLPKLQRWQISLAEQLTVAIVTSGTAKQNQPMFAEYELENVLLQKTFEVADAYRMRGILSTVTATPDGSVASNPGRDDLGMEPSSARRLATTSRASSAWWRNWFAGAPRLRALQDFAAASRPGRPSSPPSSRPRRRLQASDGRIFMPSSSKGRVSTHARPGRRVSD